MLTSLQAGTLLHGVKHVACQPVLMLRKLLHCVRGYHSKSAGTNVPPSWCTVASSEPHGQSTGADVTPSWYTVLLSKSLGKLTGADGSQLFCGGTE